MRQLPTPNFRIPNPESTHVSAYGVTAFLT